MRRVIIDRPFIDGMVTDQPAYKLTERQSAFAQDLVAPEGIARQRKGWAYDGTTADAADNLVAFYRNRFVLADTTRSITIDDDGDLRIHNATASGTLQSKDLGTTYLPRCVYRDELMLCAQDGESTMWRYSGASVTTTITPTTGTSFNTTAGQATLSTGSTTWTATPPIGSYVKITPLTDRWNLPIHYRILESSTTSVTLEGMLASTGLGGTSQGNTQISSVGRTFPCVPIYSAGTLAYTNGTLTITGYGTKWSTSISLLTDSDLAVVRPDGADAQVFRFGTVASDTSLTSVGGGVAADVGKSAYSINRACPFKDAQVHKGSLFGTGVAQYPNNVYVAPPGWNPSYPPGYIEPFDPSENLTSANANDFSMDSIAIPSSYDGDVNVAILSTPNPLLVLKRQSVYGIYGSFPSFSVDKIADGMGCIDIRSAISTSNGQFWAGEHGVYAYVGGQVIDLTDGKINREWRALTETFDYGVNDYCAIGQVYDHLLVSIMTASGTSHRCYVYDLRNRAWISRFTNHKARWFQSAQVDGEDEELYWVGDDDQGRVMVSAGALNGRGLAKDADGDSPDLQAWTGESIDGTSSIGDDGRMLDLSVSSNVYDVGVAGATTLGVSVVSGGSLEAQSSSTKTLTPINSDSVDRADRTRFREVNAKGRLHQVRFNTGTLGTNDTGTKIEIPEITATFRARRERT